MSGLVAPAELDELIGLSNRFGADPMFVRAGGGNASAKVGGVLWIKPSGVPLATLAADDLVPLDRARLLALVDQDPATLPPDRDPVMAVAAAARLAAAHGRRPSVELLFHALLPERLVLHTHPILVNAVTCHRDGRALAARIFGDTAVWVPYTDPGLPLAHAIVAARAAHAERTRRPAPPVTLLQNHGLIVGGETRSAIEAETERLGAAIESELALRPWRPADPAAEPDPAIVAAVTSGLGRRAVVFDPHPLAVSFAATPAGRAFMAGGPLIPDHIVYAGSWPMVLDLDDIERLEPTLVASRVEASLDAFAAARGATPSVTVVPGLGLFATGDRASQAETARDVYLDMLAVGELATRLGGIRHLADAEREFIETWEAEAYRKQVAAGG